MRRVLRALLVGLCAVVAAVVGAAEYPVVRAGGELSFPLDEGSHPDYRTEWWYVTGWLRTADGSPLGFQVTFFRSRPTLEDANPSRFAARELVIAHAAISVPRERLWHAERIDRSAFGLAGAAVGRTDVHLRDWSLVAGEGRYRAVVRGEDFALDLALERSAAVLVNGQRGYSQKGPDPASASSYYSVPQLVVRGTVTRDGRAVRVDGKAWLDHEWSSAYLDADSVGWDWLGLNFDDGGALMAFRIRDSAGGARWAGGTLRTAAGVTRVLAPPDVEFTAGRAWTSPRTAIRWPVEWRVRAGPLAFDLVPLMDDQESDTRRTTGAVYWEGAVTARTPAGVMGHGYLELTGYGERLRLR